MKLPRADLAAVDQLLANLFLTEVDAELLRELAQPDIADMLDLLEPGLASYVRDTDWTEAALEELAAEYARLFLMPDGVSPYAASWMQGEEGAIRARLSDEISTLYEVLRLQPTDFGRGNVPADHIGMILALTAAALQTEVAPKGEGLAGRAAGLIRPWAPQFSERLLEETGNPLYRGAGRLLLFVLEEAPAD